jgi:hypothetical protein
VKSANGGATRADVEYESMSPTASVAEMPINVNPVLLFIVTMDISVGVSMRMFQEPSPVPLINVESAEFVCGAPLMKTTAVIVDGEMFVMFPNRLMG